MYQESRIEVIWLDLERVVARLDGLLAAIQLEVGLALEDVQLQVVLPVVGHDLQDEANRIIGDDGL